MSTDERTKLDISDAAEAMLQELGGHPEGLTALALADGLVGRGFSSYIAQRAIQRALDSGEIGLGPNLELRMAERA